MTDSRDRERTIPAWLDLLEEPQWSGSSEFTPTMMRRDRGWPAPRARAGAAPGQRLPGWLNCRLVKAPGAVLRQARNLVDGPCRCPSGVMTSASAARQWTFSVMTVQNNGNYPAVPSARPTVARPRSKRRRVGPGRWCHLASERRQLGGLDHGDDAILTESPGGFRIRAAQPVSKRACWNQWCCRSGRVLRGLSSFPFRCRLRGPRAIAIPIRSGLQDLRAGARAPHNPWW